MAMTTSICMMQSFPMVMREVQKSFSN